MYKTVVTKTHFLPMIFFEDESYQLKIPQLHTEMAFMTCKKKHQKNPNSFYKNIMTNQIVEIFFWSTFIIFVITN